MNTNRRRATQVTSSHNLTSFLLPAGASLDRQPLDQHFGEKAAWKRDRSDQQTEGDHLRRYHAGDAEGQASGRGDGRHPESAA